MSGNKSTPPRSIVMELLLEAEKGERKSHLLLRDVLNKYDYLDARDKAFIKRLAEGCLEERLQLDYFISRYAVTKSGKIKPVIRVILRMGIYQILYMDSVPDAAACNEAVKLAAGKGFQGLRGFVNGVLRRIAREKGALPWPEPEGGMEYLSVYYSVPRWIIEMWMRDYGAEKTGRMLASFRGGSAATIHVREDLPTEEREALEAKLLDKDAGWAAEAHPYLSYAYRVQGMEGIDCLPGFAEGKILVQDVSSMLAVELAGIPRGAYVVDLCAAPGGKSVHAAIKTGAEGCVDARDLSEAKTAMIRENRERMNLKQLVVREWDAALPDEALAGKADVVIADLPCSGLGVIGRKGDIRYHVTQEGILELQKLQRKILETAFSYLKSGGLLVYSTCTVSRMENDENRKWILDTGSFTPVDITGCLPEELAADAEVRSGAKEGFLQLYPGIHKCDGFFISYYKKV